MNANAPTKTEPSVMGFDNGLTTIMDDKLDDLMIALSRIRLEIEDLGRHRTYSLAVTKIEEAQHWLRARKHSAP